MMDEAAEVRYWAKVRKTESCWEWTAGLLATGYGSFFLHGATRRAHRIAYELCVGPIPPGLVLDHLCRNRVCVNPEHLEPVTDRVNVLRGVGPTAINIRVTHCPRGHRYDAKNTYCRPDGSRVCRTCSHEYDRTHREQRRQAEQARRTARRAQRGAA